MSLRLCVCVWQRSFHEVGCCVSRNMREEWLPVQVEGEGGLVRGRGKVCAPRWEEADLGSSQSLPLEFSELPAGMMLHIAAGCVKASAPRSIRGLLSMFSHT